MALAFGLLARCDARSGEGVGGLWLVEAENLAAVEALYQSDPLWPTGLRKSVQDFEWQQVFVERKRLVGPQGNTPR
jgi:hypothetical protein